jgi:hypothetical protein
MRASLALLASCLLVGCAATKVENTWTANQPPAQPIQKFAVFAVTGSPSGRIAYEETLTTRLKEAGLPAVPGYDLVTYDEHPSKEEVMRRLEEKQIDGALVSRIDRRTTKTESTPVWVGGGYAVGFYDYYYTPGRHGHVHHGEQRVCRRDGALQPPRQPPLLGSQQHQPHRPHQVRERHREAGRGLAQGIGLFGPAGR